jgi:type IV pilus assembly protein PilY1
VASAPSKGLVVLSIDLATGQKLWQWQQPYVPAGQSGDRGAANSVPAQVAVRNGSNGAYAVYIGDMEGRLWELDANTGQSLTAVHDPTSGCAAGSCNYAAFDTKAGLGSPTAPQPITTNVVTFTMPDMSAAAANSSPLQPYGGEAVAMFATGGQDWVPGNQGGAIHFLLLGDNRRTPVLSGGTHLDGTPWSLSGARGDAASKGVFQEPAGLPLTLNAPERVYGSIAVINNTAYVVVTSSLNGTSAPQTDPLLVDRFTPGKLVRFELANMPTSVASAVVSGYSLANVGGVSASTVTLPSGNQATYVVGTEVSKFALYEKPSAAGAPGKPTQAAYVGMPYRLLNFVRRFMSQQ